MKLLILGIILWLMAIVAFSDTIVNPASQPVNMRVVGAMAAATPTGTPAAASPTPTATASAFDPTSIAGLKLWLKADALALSDGAAVSAWNDSSPSGYNVTQGNGGFQPKYKTGIVNGKPVVRFDGVDDYLLNDAAPTIPTGSTGYTVFVVTESATIAAGFPSVIDFALNPATEGTGPSVEIRRNVDELDHVHFDTGYVLAKELAGVVVGQWNLITADWNGSNIHLWRNGTLKDTAGTTLIGQTGSRTIVGCNSSGNNFWNGDIAEILVYNSALSTTDRQNVENYLKTKYATP